MNDICTDISTLRVSSEGLKLTAFWKRKMHELFKLTYGRDGINYRAIDEFLDKLIAKSHNPKANMRDIYRDKYWEINLDDILEIVDNKQLIIGANGNFTVRQHIRLSEQAEYIIDKLNTRSKQKKLEIAADAAGDIITKAKQNNLQNATKEYVNSGYGVSTMPGFILFSPDTASMITSQARELISEMMWTLEKLLESNLTFANTNEFYSYINEVTKLPITNYAISKYNIRIPSYDKLVSRLKDHLDAIPDSEKSGFDNKRTLFLMVRNIAKDPIKAVNFYYRNNMYEFLKDHPNVMGIFNNIMESRVEFLSPIEGDMERSDSKVYIEPLWELVDIFKAFLIVPLPTYDRVEKYINRGRKTVIISDTDSVIVCLNTFVDFMNDHGTVKFDKTDNVYESDIFRIVNSISFVCTEICNFMGENMAKHCYVPEKYRSRIRIKNEFYFPSVIIYPYVKKNYSTHTRLREGALVDRVVNTGLQLTGSNINPWIKENLDLIIEEEIHNKYDISVTSLMKRIYGIESTIRTEIMENRNVTYATFTSYKTSLRDKPWSDGRVRGVECWNRLYDNNIIEPFNKIYVFNTVLENEKDLWKIKDPTMREHVRKQIFESHVSNEYVRYGLRTIAIPDTMKQFPAWLTDIIDINKSIEKHMTPITSLLPSVGIYVNRIKSNRSHVSSLIQL